MSHAQPTTAKPPGRPLRRFAVRTTVVLLVAASVYALLAYDRHRRTVEVTRRVERLGGSVRNDKHTYPGWAAPFVGRVPFVRQIVARPLVFVDLSGVAVTADDLRAVVSLPDLRALSLHDAHGVDDDVVAELARSETLETLGLSGPGVTDAAVRRLAGVTTLQEVILDGTAVTDAAVDALRGLPKIRHIGLWSPGISAVAGKDFTATGPAGEALRPGVAFTVTGQVFVRDVPAGGSLRIVAMVTDANRQLSRLGQHVVPKPASGWNAVRIASTLPLPGPYEVEVLAYDDDGPPVISYRVARFSVVVEPAAP